MLPILRYKELYIIINLFNFFATASASDFDLVDESNAVPRKKNRMGMVWFIFFVTFAGFVLRSCLLCTYIVN